MSSGRRRSTALVVALIASTLFLGACGSDNSSARAADLADQKAAARYRAALARRWATAAVRPRTAKKPSTTSTSTPAPPTTIKTQARTTAAKDLSASRRMVKSLNAAFRHGVASGIASANAVNFWVLEGSYSGEQCTAFQSTRGRGLVSERLALHADSLVPSPGWVDPVLGKVPAGRIYRVTVDETQTLVPTGQHRSRKLSIHVTVESDGRARLLLRCS